MECRGELCDGPSLPVIQALSARVIKRLYAMPSQVHTFILDVSASLVRYSLPQVKVIIARHMNGGMIVATLQVTMRRTNIARAVKPPHAVDHHVRQLMRSFWSPEWLY